MYKPSCTNHSLERLEGGSWSSRVAEENSPVEPSAADCFQSPEFPESPVQQVAEQFSSILQGSSQHIAEQFTSILQNRDQSSSSPSCWAVHQHVAGQSSSPADCRLEDWEIFTSGNKCTCFVGRLSLFAVRGASGPLRVQGKSYAEGWATTN